MTNNMNKRDNEKLKAQYEKQLRWTYDLETEVKEEKLQYSNLKEYVKFIKIENHELETSLRDKIDTLNEKIRSCEGNDKLKERRELRPEIEYSRKITSNEQSRLAIRIKEQRKRMGEDEFKRCIGLKTDW